MSNVDESFHCKGDGWKGYKGIGGGSEVAWENHGASMEPGSALGPKRHIASTSPRLVLVITRELWYARPIVIEQ